jgi:polyhydroxyalkanoate synthesis repressor PhaR
MPDEVSPPVRLIKRYSNRKLYDVEKKRYITLAEIKELLAQGCSVQVIEWDTGEDISRQTLAKILLDQEHQRPGALPLGVLRDLIVKSHGTVLDYLRRSVTSTRDIITQIETDARKQIGKIVEKGQITETEAKRFVQEIRDLAERGRTNLESLFDDQYQQTISRLNLISQQEVKQVEERLESIEERIEAMAAFLGTMGYTAPPRPEREPEEEEPPS